MYQIFLAVSGLVLFFFVFAGVGILVRRSFGLSGQDTEGVLSSFWAGWASVIFILQIWNIFFPINLIFLILIAVFSAAGLVLARRRLQYLLIKIIPEYRIFLVFFVLSLLCLASVAVLPRFNGDCGLYHLTSVSWAKNFSAVPGIGNLHGRLAFNSSYFLYVAMLDCGPWVHKSRYLANSLLMAVLFSHILVSCKRLFRSNEDIRPSHVLYILTLLPVLKQAVSADISSPSPDIAIYILGIIVAAYLLDFIESGRCMYEKYAQATLLVVFLCVTGVTIKLSFAFMAAASSTIAVSFWYIDKRLCALRERRIVLIQSVILISVGLIPWAIRGVISSGYVAYPCTLWAFPVDWRIPMASASNNANWVYSWARMPKVHWSVVLGNWSWFKPWLIRNLFAGGFDMILPLGISLSSYAWSIFFPDKAMTRSISTIKLSVFLLLSAASIIFWFLTAPDIRFAGAIFWILCSGVILFVFGCSERLKKLLIFYVVFTLFYSFFLGPVINGKLEFIKIVANREGFVKAFRELRINLKRPTGLNKPEGFYEAPVIETRTFITDSGLKLYVPKDGTLCWDAPLPCTPYPNSHLKLRKDQSLGFGFRVEPWHEEDASVGMHL